MVLALIVDGQTLHIANVGDSRIYLCRDGTLQQLTRDHTFANVMVWLGKLTPEAAASNPDADKVMRALGIHAALQVDQGVYLSTTDYGEANVLRARRPSAADRRFHPLVLRRTDEECPLDRPAADHRRRNHPSPCRRTKARRPPRP